VRRARGAALLLALLVVVLAGAVVVASAGWAILAQRAGRGWRDAARHAILLESGAAAWLAGDSLVPVASWMIVDSLEAVRFAPPSGSGTLELLCHHRMALPPDSSGSRCLSGRGYLRTPR
jgi:hypothetical protein